MTYSHDASDNGFASLCQAQTKLLTQGLGAIWSAVYLTDDLGETREKQLLLFSNNSPTPEKVPHKISEPELEEILQGLGSSSSETFSYLPLVQEQPGNQSEKSAISSNTEGLRTKQIILPLIYEEVMMGLLITVREDRFWQREELEQVKAIAKTLAVGCFLEKKSQWYRRQLEIQEDLRLWEQEQLGNLLHQLRNPLTALRTFSKLLVKRLLPEDRNQDIAKSILREGDRLGGLIDLFAQEIDSDNNQEPVTLSADSVRLQENKSTGNFLLPSKADNVDEVDIAVILEPLLQVSQVIANQKSLKLLTIIPESLPLVRGNVAGLQEVLNNLLDNALKYTPSPGTITVRIILQAGLLKIAIEDTGYGISEADQEHLFERHFRGSQAEGDIPGTGLGLAIAKQLIEQMQGDLEVISPNPHLEGNSLPGTIFTVWLSVVES